MTCLESNRTRLRRLTEGDLDNLLQLYGDAAVMRFTPTRVPQTRAQTEARLRSQLENQKQLNPLGVWAAESKDTGSFIGWFMILPTGRQYPELGFMIVPSQWRKGYAREIAARLMRHGTEDLGLEGYAAVTDPDNETSVRVLTALGFREVPGAPPLRHFEWTNLHVTRP